MYRADFAIFFYFPFSGPRETEEVGEKEVESEAFCPQSFGKNRQRRSLAMKNRRIWQRCVSTIGTHFRFLAIQTEFSYCSCVLFREFKNASLELRKTSLEFQSIHLVTIPRRSFLSVQRKNDMKTCYEPKCCKIRLSTWRYLSSLIYHPSHFSPGLFQHPISPRWNNQADGTTAWRADNWIWDHVATTNSM